MSNSWNSAEPYEGSLETSSLARPQQSPDRGRNVDDIDCSTQIGTTSISPESREFRIRRGKAIIIVGNDPNASSDEKKGNEVDKKKLVGLFKLMGVGDPLVLEDQDKECLSRKKVEQTIIDWSENKNGVLDGADCLILAILSHGCKDDNTQKEHIIIGSSSIEFQWLIKMFQNNHCKVMYCKPKLIFARCCRGKNIDFGSRTIKEKSVQYDSGISHTEPNKAEFFIAHPSFEDYKTFLRSTGSIFVDSMVDVFTSQIPKGEELHHMMTDVQGKMAAKSYTFKNNIIKENPCFTSSLTKRLYFHQSNK